ncbi:unnamed protein product [Sphagnum balticum]
MDHQWGLARTATAQQQQGVVASQYSYSSSSYPGQQAATPSSATSAMYAQPQAYSQQTYTQQTYAQQQNRIFMMLDMVAGNCCFSTSGLWK